MTAITPSATGTTASRPARSVAVWLLVCCAMVFVMVVLGGVTRLTHSGLSIVEWQPLMGVVPPMSEQAWLDLFHKYQAYPEYREINHGMTLAAFKSIYWLEYVHRLWGRLIGLVFLVPFLYFAASGRIERRLRPRLTAVFLLGALQGGLGWYMVKSGLVNRPDVSQYRLAAHLVMAFLIYAYMLWVALGLLFPGPAPHASARLRPLARQAAGLGALVLLTALVGAFVAGLDAGFAFNTFPLMNGRLIPQGFLALHPWYRSFFEDVATVQFTHRWLAIGTVALVLLLWARARRAALPRDARIAVDGFAALALVQAGLGISTLLLVVPVPLAAAHQAGALALFTAAIVCAHRLRAAAGLGGSS